MLLFALLSLVYILISALLHSIHVLCAATCWFETNSLHSIGERDLEEIIWEKL